MASVPSLVCRSARFPVGAERPRTWVMGVVNVTPDSFSDGGRFAHVEAAVAHGRRLVAEGADLLDVGGESTRPGAGAVDAATEIARVVPVIERLARAVAVPVSVDTVKGEVARAALAAGAQLVNDVTGGRDPRLLEAAAAHDAPLVVGHLRGTPRDMQAHVAFTDVFAEVTGELQASLERARAAGVTQLVADPGLGFGKHVEHNLVLLARAGALGARLGAAVMVGPSRKAFLGALTGLPVGDRLAPTLSAVACAALSGADFVRVHDVREARAALAVADAMRLAAAGRPVAPAEAAPPEAGAPGVNLDGERP